MKTFKDDKDLKTLEEEEEAIKEAALSDAYMIDGNDNAYRDHDYRK